MFIPSLSLCDLFALVNNTFLTNMYDSCWQGPWHVVSHFIPSSYLLNRVGDECSRGLPGVGNEKSSMWYVFFLNFQGDKGQKRKVEIYCRFIIGELGMSSSPLNAGGGGVLMIS